MSLESSVSPVGQRAPARNSGAPGARPTVQRSGPAPPKRQRPSLPSSLSALTVGNWRRVASICERILASWPTPAGGTTGGSDERRALAVDALDGQVAAHQPAEVPADGQAQPGPAVLGSGASLGLGECLEETAQLFLGLPDAGVHNGEREPVIWLTLDGQADRARTALSRWLQEAPVLFTGHGHGH